MGERKYKKKGLSPSRLIRQMVELDVAQCAVGLGSTPVGGDNEQHFIDVETNQEEM